jgi:hypothetical protein
MAIIEIARIQVRRGKELGGGPGSPGGVPQLEPGELGWAEDTENLYIGKRMVEGAANDNNSRILTDKDLTNLFTVYFTGSSAASTGTYRYRDGLPYSSIESTTTTVARKLDNFVSLTDFTTTNVVSSDITYILSRAIETIFSNNTYGKDAIRTLTIPAGDFTVSSTIDLPPHTTLVGDGRGITRLLHNVTNGGAMFRTVDNLGVNYDSGVGMNQNEGRSEGIYIANMTLAYNTGSYNQRPLLSLDDTQDAVIENVEFSNVSSSTKQLFLSTITFATTALSATTSTTATVVGNFSSGAVRIEVASAANIKIGDTLAPGTISVIAKVNNDLYLNVPTTSLIADGATLTFLSNSTNTYVINVASTASILPGYIVTATSSLNQSSVIPSNTVVREVKPGNQVVISQSLTSPLLNSEIVTFRDPNYRFTNTGIAMAIRGSIGTDPYYFATNVQVKDCVFNQVDKAIDIFGKVGRTTISGNTFENLNRGIRVYNSGTSSLMPMNTVISNNKFIDITGSCVETSTATTMKTDIITRENIFHRVSNGGLQPDNSATGPRRPVLNFETLGNVSVNDVFSRLDNALNTTSVYLSPLISSGTKLSNQMPYNKTVTIGGTSEVVKIPLTGKDQVGYIDYSLTNDNMSRKGRLTLNVSSDGYASVSDYYNYSEVVEGSSTAVIFSTDMTYGKMLEDPANYKGFISVTVWNYSGLVNNLEFTLELMV